MMTTIIDYDKELFVFLNGLGNEFFDNFWIFVTNKFTPIPLYLILIFLCYKKFGTKKTLIIIFFAVLLILITDQITNIAKNYFQRLRPCHDDTLGTIRILKCGGKYGFFSGHASNNFAFAMFFYLLLKKYYKWTSLLFIWAMIVAYSRIYIGVHFPGDIIVGTFVGCIMGYILYKLMFYLTHKHKLTQKNRC